MSDTLPNEVREAIARAIHDADFKPQYQTEEHFRSDPIYMRLYLGYADAALSALEAAGWVCVPKEATPEMCIAAQKSELRGGGLAFFKDVWTAMLTASNPKEKPDV